MNSRNSAECLDRLFREALTTHSTLDALALVQRYEAEDPEFRRDCHPIVHAIGRETYRLKGTIHDSFAACDQTCHSGCYHGSVERFLRGENIYAEAERHPSAAELKQKAAIACDPKIAMRLRFQCLHGLGHALLFFSRYQLGQSLEACDVLPEAWSRSSCYGGVFMENVSNATPETRDLSPTDYHYPCSKLDAKFRGECYVMQTSRMTEMGLRHRANISGMRKSRRIPRPVHGLGGPRSVEFRTHRTIARDRAKMRARRRREPARLHARRGLRAHRQHLGRPLRAAILRHLRPRK